MRLEPVVGRHETVDALASVESTSSAASYARELAVRLPAEAFRRVPARLLWVAFHAAIVGSVVVLQRAEPPLMLRIAASLFMGHSLGCLALLGHEVLHGSVVRSRPWRKFWGGVCMAQYGLAPEVWVWWHNKSHHRFTQAPLHDPDCTGTLAVYRHSVLLRTLERFLPGSRLWTSLFFPFLHFTFVSIRAIYAYRNRTGRALGARAYHVAVLGAWALVSYAAAPRGIVFLMLLPLAASNVLLMSYIATNHLLSQLTQDVNDPLANTLTVRTFRLFDLLHLQFGYHVEHHLFPNMSGRYLPRVAPLLRQTWQDRYCEMSHGRALVLLYTTPRVYLSNTTLVDPRTGTTSPTLPQLCANVPRWR